MNEVEPMQTSSERLWRNSLTFLLLLSGAVARGEPPSETPSAVPVRSLADAAVGHHVSWRPAGSG